MRVALVLVLLVSVARAEPKGAESLTRGIQALDGKQYKQAENLFDAAIAKGGLTRVQTLTTYVDLGVTLVLLGKTDAAERAFEEAARIDPKFVVPKKSGAIALRLADQARKREDGVGPYHMDIAVPEHVPAGKAFTITVKIPGAQVEHVGLVRVAADEASGKSFETIEPSASRVAIEIPANLAVADATISFRFELLDTHENKLAAEDQDVAIEAAVAVEEPQPKPESKPEQPDKKPDEGDDETADESGPWAVAHGSKKYTATRADGAIVIDGKLDEPVWQKAARDDRFLSTKSKPFGKPTTQPTSVQVAYDDTNLYVAVRCAYAKPHAPSDAYAADEASLLSDSESVAVVVDGVHGHTGAYEFAVSPAGVRADAELSDQGAAQNLDWHGIWNVDTHVTDDGWTAEFEIPWGTMYLPSHDDGFDIGLEVQRHEPNSGEIAVWSLEPPATEIYDVNYFGHVDGMSSIHPGQRLLLLPYAALALDSTALAKQSTLTDFTGTGGQGRIYAGGYLRLRPPGPFRLDATFNPDFSAVTPDAAIANFDRFELEYPEVRTFFSEDAPRFAFGATRYFFGDLGGQLFYSRRLGIETDTAGLTSIVPILYGVKSVLQTGGTEAAVMNVETVKAVSGVTLDDNATVARVNETVEGQRLGVIGMTCQACGTNALGNPAPYSAGGADTAISLYDRHLQLSGFFAATQVAGAASAAGEGTVQFKSQDVYAKATLLDIGKDFQAPLGFFTITGVRAETTAAGYTPVVRSDLVQQVFIESQLSIVRDRDSDALVYQRAVIAGSLQTIDGALVSAQVQPSTEVVAQAFPIGNGRIMVQPGTYKVLGTQFDVTSPPNHTVIFGVHYSGGDLFDGTRRAPGVVLGVNLGRFLARASYTLYILKFEDQNQDFLGSDVSLTASYAYSPLARTSLVLEADSVAARGTAQLTTTIQFGRLSALTIAIRGQSGSTIDTPAMNTFDNPGLSAIVSLALGVSPL